MDVFFNPIFSRDSNNPNQQRSSNRGEKMSFQPNLPQEEKFTFNPQNPSNIQNKLGFPQNNHGFNEYKYEQTGAVYTDRDQPILLDMSMQSSSLNNTSMLSAVDQSKIEKNFFRNPLYTDNSIHKKTNNSLYFENDQKRDYYPAYEDYNLSMNQKKKDDLFSQEKEKSNNFELKLLDFNQNSVDISKSNISIRQYTNPEFDQEFANRSFKNSIQTHNINPGNLMNSLDNNTKYQPDQKSSNIYLNPEYGNSNIKSFNYYQSPQFTKGSNNESPKYDENDIFKRTAEFKQLGFGSNPQYQTSEIRNTFGLLPQLNEKKSPTLPLANKSLDINEKDIYQNVSQLKEKVVSTLSTYKENLAKPEKKSENLKNFERQYQQINTEYSQIIEKYSDLSVSHVAESGFISNSNLSYFKTGGPNENEINNMMDLVHEFLDKFQPKPPLRENTETRENERVTDKFKSKEIVSNSYSKQYEDSSYKFSSNQNNQNDFLKKQQEPIGIGYYSSQNQSASLKKTNEGYGDYGYSTQNQHVSLKKPYETYEDNVYTQQNQFKNQFEGHFDMKSTNTEKTKHHEHSKKHEEVGPLGKIDEIKRQRKNEELEQSFLTIRNNVTAYDLDKTRNFTDVSYLSEISILAPPEKEKPTKQLTVLPVYKKQAKVRIFGFFPKLSRFIKTKEDLKLTRNDFEDIELICDKCSEVLRPSMWRKHINSCIKSDRKWTEESPLSINVRENESRINQVINKLYQKLIQNKNSLEKAEIFSRLLSSISIFLSKMNNDALNSVLKNLFEFNDFLISRNAVNQFFSFSVLQERILSLLSERNLGKKKNFSENVVSFFVDIDSDDEENRKKVSDKTSLVNVNANQNINAGSFKKKNEKNISEEIKNYFFTEAINLKFALPANHPSRNILISDLYEDSLKENIQVEDFRKYLEKRFKY